MRSLSALGCAVVIGLVAPIWQVPAGTAGVSVASDESAAVVVTDPAVEYASEPLGLDVERPRLSWTLTSTERAQAQSAYRILVASTPEALAAGDADVWDSGRVESSRSHLVEYDGPALTSRTRYHWKVMVWDAEGQPSAWSEPSWWEMGLLEQDDFEGSWIGHETDERLPVGNVEENYPAELDAGATLGQTFTADRPVAAVSGRFPTWNTSDSAVTLTLFRDGPGGEQIASERVEDIRDNAWVQITLDEPVGPGTYYLQQSEPDGSIGWWSHHDDVYPHGEAFENGEPAAGDRTIQWVPAVAEADGRTPQLRTEFSLSQPVTAARLYATSLGVYEMELNGEPVGDEIFAPGWTDYDERVQYQTYDVTELLAEGDNAIGATIAPGWYAGYLAIFGPDHYGTQPWLWAQLEVTYADGSVETVTTDETWRSSTGPVLSSDFLMGEVYDARERTPGWTQAGFDDESWQRVVVDEDAVVHRVAQVDPPVRVTEEIEPVEVSEPEEGVYVFDLGQNMVGAVRLEVEGPRGTTLTLRHAEVLNPDGTLYTDNLRTAKATDTYTLAGDGVETYEPEFTFHGFRYVEVTGFPGELTADAITGRVMHTDSPMTGQLETSSPMLNQLFSNIMWGQRGNFLSIPTDTPARDERMGWTGDINVFAGAAVYNMESATFLTKWLQDLRDAQFENGAFTDVAPIIGFLGAGSAGWGDAGVTVPHTLWQQYGDVRQLEEHYESMQAWIDYLVEHSTGYLRPPEGYGDWLNVDDETPKDVIATAYFAHSAALVSETAQALGRETEAEQYADLAADVRAAFNDAYVSTAGRVQGDTQTAYVLALSFDLLPDELRRPAADRLVQLIEDRDWHLSTGFLGTPDLLPVLTEHGHLDVAYRLINQDTYPSWGYQIGNGATTMWEHWDSIKPDGSFQNPEMNSFNHYAYGAVGEWMFRTIAGIENAAPGFSEIVIRPQPGGGLDHASATYESVMGSVSSSWRTTDQGFELETRIPVNTEAEVWVPAVNEAAVTESGLPAAEANGVAFDRMESGYAVFRAGSGEYTFSSDDVAGHLHDAAHRAAALSGLVNELGDAGDLTEDQHGYLRSQSDLLSGAIDLAAAARESGDERRTVREVQRAASVTDRMNDWVAAHESSNELPSGVAQRLRETISDVRTALSAASVQLLGIRLTLEPAASAVAAGDVVEATFRVENTGPAPVQDVQVHIEPPEGWSAEPTEGDRAGVLRPGDSHATTFAIEVPPDDPVAGGLLIHGTATFKRGGGSVHAPITTSVDVVSPVVIEDLSADPRILDEPGELSTVTLTLANRSSGPVTGTVAAALPDGWGVQPEESGYELAPGDTQLVSFEVTSPPEPAAATMNLTAHYAGNLGDTASLRLTYSLVSWLFETDGDAEGWEPANHLSDLHVEDGLLRTTSLGGDPFMIAGDELDIDGTDGLTVEVTMEVSADSGGQVFWTTADEPSFSEGKSVKFAVEGGGMRTYTAEVPSFDGRLTGLRLDPMTGPGDITIDAIRVLR